MALMTGDEYRESLRARRPLRVHFGGERLADPLEHPIVAASVNSMALTYELASDESWRGLAVAQSDLVGEPVSRFCHLHGSADDLVAKVKLLRELGRRCGTCFQRCVGMDGINAVYAVTHAVDAEHGTDYHRRFSEFLREVQRGDLSVNGCMTDVKGERGKRPADQADPDAYLRIVERRPDGIVIRGAKAHQTGAVNCHQVLVMPTAAMREADRDYAVCCAVPSDDPGLVYVYGRQSSDLRRLDTSPAGCADCGNSCYGGQECLVVFDDVFVPSERVFLDGETGFTGTLVEYFAGYHRQSYGGCKVGVGDVLIGATASIAEYNGAAGASHVRDKLVEMIHLNETLYACGLACSAAGRATPAGNWLIDMLLANVTKQNVTRFPYEIARLAQDIAGGLVGTLPSARDLEDPETGPLLRKYLRGADGVPAESRFRMMRLIENLTMGRAAVGYLVESMHGAGSPQAQRIMISRLADLEDKKRCARRLAGIEE
ncbi:MAG: 4-hydroxyphenylacetate 3-hydroxylase family protein [Planctomycetota bacterium]|jgi:4-hydroxybutyryl-CoA dehydratase/vinylacetyl-CoA-Delta-isomerase